MVMNKASSSKVTLKKSSILASTPLKNTLYVSLKQLRYNYVTLNKEVIWTANWMGNQQDSAPIRLKTPNDQTEESIDLKIDFSFSIETTFTQSYLNNIINNPVLITACDASAGRSLTKASGKIAGDGKTAGDVLGQCCLDILPLFTNRKNVTSKMSETPKNVEDSGEMFNSNDQPRKSTISLGPTSPTENVNQVKIRDEITADLILEAKDTLLGSAVLTPMNKMNLVASASLSLESPIPEELASTNILTLTVESAYNFPPPLCEPEYDFTSLRYSVAVTLPLDAGPSRATLEMGGKSKKSLFSMYSSDNSDIPLPQETTNYVKILFSNSHPGTHPDKTFRVKWKHMEDIISGNAKYSSRRLPKHTRDVKYGETVRLVAEGKNHVQWNQMERVWLTENTEDMIRHHVEMYGMWPVEIKIESAPVTEKKKDKYNKSFISIGGGNLNKGPKPAVDTFSAVTLPIHQLALVELSDLLYPGLTQSRVLATFIPNPTEEILRCKTGLEKFAYITTDVQNMSTMSNNKSKRSAEAPALPLNSDDTIRDIKNIKSMFQVGGTVPAAFVEKPEKPSEEYAEDVNENFPADPFCIIVHLEFSRPLTEKPEQETLLLELNNVINVKQLYKPDPSRRAAKKTLDQFEKAIAKVSHMFYAEYEDYVKLRTRVEHDDTIEKSKTMQKNEKTNKTRTKPVNETEADEQPWNDLTETTTCATTHANKQKLRSKKTVNNNEPDMEAFGDQYKISKTENYSSSHEQLLSLPQIHISIPVDFREYLTRSGSLAKAFTLLELPLREYIYFYYKPDGNETHLGVDYITLYSMEKLTDIHAQVVQLMSKIVENVANALPAQDVRCARNGMLRTLLQTDTVGDTAAFLAKQLAYAMQYQEEGYMREAEQLLVSRIQNVKKSNSNNARVWEEYGRFCLGEGRFDAARVSLEQSLFLSTSQETLMMLGYVSYRLDQLDQTDLYLSLLTILYDSSVEAWTTLGVYYTLRGKHNQARTVFHIAHTLLVNYDNGGETEKSNSKSGNGLSEYSISTGSESKSNGEKKLSYNENSSFASNDLTTLLDTEHSWLDPTPCCFQGETHGNSKFLKSCPLLLTLNMFEFAETCIGEHLLQLNKSSALAAYYYAVSQYKQGHYHAALSHLNDIPNPLSKCIPVLVLKFHCACAMNSAQIREKYGPDASKLYVTTSAESFSGESKTENVYLATNLNETSSRLKNQSKKSNNTADSSSDPCAPYYIKDPSRDPDFNAKHRYGQNDWNLAPSLTQCQQYYKSMQWEVEAYDKLKWFVLMRLGRMSTIKEVESEMRNPIKKTNSFENINPEKQNRKSKMSSTYENIESEIRLKNSTGISSTQEIESEQLLTDAEQYLLRVIKHQITPLNWYYLGLVYIKTDKLTQAELALNEANKLDPEFGDAWASLALVNYRMRHLSLFQNCLVQARKYRANSRLLKALESLVPLL